MSGFETETELTPQEKRAAETYRVGEGLYGLSLHELQARIKAYTIEIDRLRAEMAGKASERSAADALFARKGE